MSAKMSGTEVVSNMVGSEWHTAFVTNPNSRFVIHVTTAVWLSVALGGGRAKKRGESGLGRLEKGVGRCAIYYAFTIIKSKQPYYV